MMKRNVGWSFGRLVSVSVVLSVFGAAQAALAYEEGSVVKRAPREGAHPQLTPLDLDKARPYVGGFVREGDTFVCENTAPTDHRGVHWSITLNQSAPVAVCASALALVERADAGDPGGFSLYLDIQYMDGSFLWGQMSAFAPDAALGWQRREVLVYPARPIRTVSYYLLFRTRAGKVTFKEPCFQEVGAGNAVLFDTLITETAQPPSRGFLLRDVAAGSDIVALNEAAKGVGLSAVSEAREGVTFYDVTLKDLTGNDRALTLYYTLPLAAGALQWCGSFRGSAEDVASSRFELMNVTRQDVGANGFVSRWPLAAVVAGGRGVAIGLDPATPLVCRMACQPVTRELFLACDVGLAPERPPARFRFVVFEFPAQEGLRGAFDRYYTIFPEAFAVRVAEQGGWMAFAPISKLAGFEDFGFRFKEGNDEIAWDDAHGILTFRYTEPLTWWMTLEGEKTIARGMAEARRLAESGNEYAKAWLTSTFHDEQGQPPGMILDTPWCNGVVWSMNGAPGIPGDVTEFSAKFKPDYVKASYGQPRPADGKGIDGEYIDSAEAYVTAVLDFRRDHFVAASRPLCYSTQTRKVGAFKGMICFEYVRALAEATRGNGYYMMANSTPDAWFWLAPLLDVMGTETNWKHDGKWTPMTDADFMLRRALCKGKPYCFLMNTDFTKWTYDDSERFMKACVAYGVFPGFFSVDASSNHYFHNPEYYDRDRPLFKRYMPLCKRVAQAGWEPLTGASSANTAVIIERFGDMAKGGCLTVYNPTATPQAARITRTPLGGAAAQSHELVNGTTVEWRDNATDVTLDPYGVLVLANKDGTVLILTAD